MSSNPILDSLLKAQQAMNNSTPPNSFRDLQRHKRQKRHKRTPSGAQNDIHLKSSPI
jgi:hypothetical protein